MALVGVLGLQPRGRLEVEGGVRRTMTAIGLAALVTGVAVAVRGAVALGPSLTPLPYPREGAEMVETDIYRRIRHPMYAGVMLAAFGFATALASVPSLIASGLLALWLDVKARREEAWLLERFPRYAGYRSSSYRFFPGLY